MKIILAVAVLIAATHGGYLALDEVAINRSAVASGGETYGIVNTITALPSGAITYIVENVNKTEAAEREGARLVAAISDYAEEKARAEESVRLLDGAIEGMKLEIEKLRVRASQIEAIKNAKSEELKDAENKADKLLMPPWVFYALIVAFASAITMPLWKTLIYSSGKNKKNAANTGDTNDESHAGNAPIYQ